MLTTTQQSPTSNLWNSCTLLENIRREQHKDPYTRRIIDEFSNTKHPVPENFQSSFILINDILYKRRAPMKHLTNDSLDSLTC